MVGLSGQMRAAMTVTVSGIVLVQEVGSKQVLVHMVVQMEIAIPRPLQTQSSSQSASPPLSQQAAQPR